eukprot:TRINITY_DN9853_c0_g1_i5.p1 TRINITY_DN9853_c0_g1~~TRINITY_DN9853_c0_g1_i5.p1  ORF type:complete len:115 (-),score=21.46 TRINITY_DN9853_c0_g1_i5:39-383(-)
MHEGLVEAKLASMIDQNTLLDVMKLKDDDKNSILHNAFSLKSLDISLILLKTLKKALSRDDLVKLLFLANKERVMPLTLIFQLTSMVEDDNYHDDDRARRRRDTYEEIIALIKE